MSWPKKVLNPDTGDIFHFHSDMHPLEMAWYRENDKSSLVKFSKQDLVMYLEWDWDEEAKEIQKTPDNSNIIRKCEYDWDHLWKKYIGFNEVYEYCTICDKKRDIKNG